MRTCKRKKVRKHITKKHSANIQKYSTVINIKSWIMYLGIKHATYSN